MFAALKSGSAIPVIPKSTPAPGSQTSASDNGSAQRSDKSLQVKVYNIPEGTDQVNRVTLSTVCYNCYTNCIILLILFVIAMLLLLFNQFLFTIFFFKYLFNTNHPLQGQRHSRVTGHFSNRELFTLVL